MNQERMAEVESGGVGGLASDVQRYLSVARRWWWLIAVATLLCGGAAWWSQRDEVPVYTAEALLQQKVEGPVMGAGDGFAQGADFGSQAELIRSRTVLASVVDSLGLQLELSSHPGLRSELLREVRVDRDAETGGYVLKRDGDAFRLLEHEGGPEVGRAEVGELLEGSGFRATLGDPGPVEKVIRLTVRDHQRAVARTRSRLQVERGEGADIIKVRFQSPDGELAADVVNAVAHFYQRYRATEARQAASRRKNVIAGEIEHISDSLRLAQEDVESYQAESGVLDPGIEIQALMEERFAKENELRELQDERALLQRLVNDLQGPDPDDESLHRIMAMGREVVPDGERLERRLQELQAERRALVTDRFGATEESPEVEVLDAQIESTRDQMRIAAEQSLELLSSRIASTEQRIEGLRQEVGDLPSRAAGLARREEQAGVIQRVFDELVEGYYEAQVAEGVEAGDVAVVDAAEVPLGPDPSRGAIGLVVALLGGLLVGMVGAMVLDQFDNRIRRTLDLQKAAPLDVLGTVPRIRSRGRDAKTAVVAVESFRGIRTNLRFALPTGSKVLAVCSAAPSEGKTTVAVNLALTHVEEGERVLVVDGDFRRARVHETLGVDKSPGLADVLTGRSELSHAIQPSTAHDSLHVLASGTLRQSQASLFSGVALERVLWEARSLYDRVIVDTPPVLVASEAAMIASLADGNLLVVRSNGTDRGALESAMAQLRRVEATLVGVILNDVNLKSVGYSRYYDDYYKSEDAEDEWEKDEASRRLLVG